MKTTEPVFMKLATSVNKKAYGSYSFVGALQGQFLSQAGNFLRGFGDRLSSRYQLALAAWNHKIMDINKFSFSFHRLPLY